MTSWSPSTVTDDSATRPSSATSAGSKRLTGSATLEYSRVSEMRPARSWYFTKRYFSFTARRSVSFGGSNQSRITLKT